MTDNVEDAASAFLNTTAPSQGGGSKSRRKKKKNKTPDESAVEAIAENSAESNPEKATGSSEAQTAPAPASMPDDAARIMAELGIGNDTEKADGGGAKKKKRKGKKPKPKEKEKVSVMGKLAAMHLEKQREEEEKKRQEAEELRKEEEEAKRIEDEENRKEEERKEKLKEKRRKKKEEAKKAGKAVTKAQRLREQRAKMMRDQLIAQGKIKVDADGRVVVEKKSKPAAKKGTSSTPKASKSADAEATSPSVEPAKEVSQPETPATDAPEQQDKEDKEKEPEQVIEAPEVVEEEPKPLVSNWEDLGNDDWESNFANGSLTTQPVDSKFADEEEVVQDDYVRIRAPKSKSRRKKGSRTEQAAEAKGSEVASHQEAGSEAGREEDGKKELRSPICCVMGHVDTGKTKMLDKLRKTNVQDNEAGGITQQIGATYFPMDKLRKSTDRLNDDLNFEYKVPGLLMIDTPGHESFSNLRKRGSTLCDIAILIVDLMHGLEQQTIESINLLREKKTPFIVALNKIDRLYSWKAHNDSPFRETLSKQDENVVIEFENRTKQVITQLMQQGLNAKLYYENKDFKSTVCLVPTSAHTGEGIPDLLLLLIQLTQKMLFKKLVFRNELECNVIEVKKIEGIGTTVDVILVNGELREGDEIIVATLSGPVRTQVKALLTPQPLKEMRVKSNYVHHKSIQAAMGVKIVAQNLEEAIAGTQIIVYDEKKDKHRLQAFKDKVMEDYETIISNIDQSGYGVCVQASTLGSLEALIDFLKSEKIPINSVNLGPIHKKDVMRASVMLEHKKEFATILAFDVKVTKDAQELSEDLGVRIFTADIIYHLFDQFTKYMEGITEQRKASVTDVAVFPCVLQIIAENVFNKKSPLILGVDVVEGIIKTGTPLVIPDRLVPDPDNPDEKIMLSLGKIESIQKDHKEVQTAKKGSKVCIKISGSQSESYVQYGRHFDHENLLYSKLSRESIDSLKTHFKNDLEKSDWLTVIKLKKVFNIV